MPRRIRAGPRCGGATTHSSVLHIGVVGCQSMAVAEWLLFARMHHLSDWGQFGTHIYLRLNYKPVNLTSNRLLWEFWLSFFYSQGSLRYKAFLDYKKSLCLTNSTATARASWPTRFCLFTLPSRERLRRLHFKWKPYFGFQAFHDSSNKSISGKKSIVFVGYVVEN